MNSNFYPYHNGNMSSPSYFHNKYHNHYHPQHAFRQYPTINPATFMKSAKEMETLMHDATLLLTKMASSRQFSFEFMSAAQASKQDKIQNMLKSTGIKRIPKVSYTPDGLYLNFESGIEQQKCCQLAVKLRWV
ncbi:hypothetical protein KDN24_19550 [Bacillus sp. Bva_UNVM-123]|uniref:hypothetical protein n=1 Tax=Bacillus sp. Bva_UNVM-123 TaxID=2829798 RepID=UPI00391EEA03